MEKKPVGFFGFRGQWAISPRATVAHAVLFTIGMTGFVWYIVQMGGVQNIQKTHTLRESLRVAFAGMLWVGPMFADLLVFGWLRIKSFPEDSSTP